MSRIFKGSESTLRLLISKSTEYNSLASLRIKLYTTNIDDAIEVIDGITIDGDTAILNLPPRAFIGMEDGVINYVIEGVVDGDLFHTERQSNYYLKSLSYINENGVATQTLTITENGEFRITPNDGLYVDIKVDIPVQIIQDLKTVKATDNTVYYIQADPEYTSMKEVMIEVDVPLQAKEITLSENTHYTINPDPEYKGMTSIDIEVNLPIQKEKDMVLTAGSNGVLRPDEGYEAIQQVKYRVTENPKLPNGISFATSQVEEFDGSNHDWSYVYDTSEMFANSSVRRITEFNISKPYNLKQMFYNCQGLSYVEGIENWDVSCVGDMSEMFTACYAYKDYNLLNNWDTSNVENLDKIFNEARNLGSLNLSNWDVSNVTTMTSGFTNGGLSGYVNLENWSFKKLRNCDSLFAGQKMEVLNAPQLITSAVTSMKYMFKSCTNLTQIIGLENWDVSNVTDMTDLFSQVSGLTSVDLSKWDVSKVTKMSGMFYQGPTEIKFGGPLNSSLTIGSLFVATNSIGTLYYPQEYDYSIIIKALPAAWEKIAY